MGVGDTYLLKSEEQSEEIRRTAISQKGRRKV
jgi:hypothetical protein